MTTPVTTQPLRSPETPTEVNNLYNSDGVTSIELKENSNFIAAATDIDDVSCTEEPTEREKEKKQERRRSQDTDCCCVYSDDNDVCCLYFICRFICDCFRCIGLCTESCFECCAQSISECCEGDGCCMCDDGDAVGDGAGHCVNCCSLTDCIDD